MRKILFKLSFLFLLFGVVSLLHPAKIFAQSLPFDCKVNITIDPSDKQITENEFIGEFDKITFDFDLSGITDSQWGYFSTNGSGEPEIFDNPLKVYENYGWGSIGWCPLAEYSIPNRRTQIPSTPVDLSNESRRCSIDGDGEHQISLQYYNKFSSNPLDKYEPLCKSATYKVEAEVGANIDVQTTGGVPPDANATWEVTISDVKIKSFWLEPKYWVDLNDNSLNYESGNTYLKDKKDLGKFVGNFPGKTVEFTLNKLPPASYTIKVLVYTTVNTPIIGAVKRTIASKTFEVYPVGQAPSSTPTPTPTIFGAPTSTPVPPVPSLAPICDQLPITNNFRSNCWNCINTGGIWTAIGCVPTDLELILKDYIFVYGVGIAGGIAFLYFLYGVFLILTSAGNAEKIAEGKEIIISALSGLFLIIFSVFLLRVIGYDILKIPGFE